MEPESSLRNDQFEMQIDFSPTPEAKALHDQRIDTLANWLPHRWETERRETLHGRSIPADHSGGSR